MTLSGLDIDRMTNEARDLGTAAGRTGASWVFDGNTADSTYQECVRLDNDGDPEWWDRFGPPNGPLSGEWADSETPRSLATSVGLENSTDPDGELLPTLCGEYESAYSDSWHTEVMRLAHQALSD